ncbi:MAG: diguanylate cyclase [Gammaproteobacteria bacterium]|nr:diguanylate cyclase [Gammaproteobacteria bacterium]
MDDALWGSCGFDENTIVDRLRLIELDQEGMEASGRQLHDHVVVPNIDAIVDRFYESLLQIDEFNRIVDGSSTAARLRQSQEHYLLGLGIDFHKRAYFEERLRIGAVHQRVGVPQSLYQSTFQGLQSLLIEYIPPAIRDDAPAFSEMIRFILKITALDMSLAVESYCSGRVSDLTKSLEDERDETVRLRQLAVTDWLTKLRNHSYSKRCLGAALERTKIDKSLLCVIMADLDNFKEINDAHGHLVGDEILQIAARRMLSSARAHDEICRYGGEEFLFILNDTSITDGEEVAERMRTRINSDAMNSRDTQLMVTMSLGVAQARDGDTVDTLIERADQALYAAKRAGRDCVRTAA